MSVASSSFDQEVPPAIVARFLALISARTGLQIREKDRRDLQRTLFERMAALKIERSETYLQLLEGQPSVKQGEWARLLPRLTNGESYFWRDKGQFSLLKTRLLPELIEARSATRSLRIWSAGCSSGEEPYSLAMLVDELLPNRNGWNISILGTDINPVALDKARAGVYGAWAFRGLDTAIQEKYFERNRGEFRINPRIQSMVTFGLGNLRGDEFPSRVSGVYDMDLILCRNVLIYFGSEAIGHALQGFARTLREGGYLLTGHAELANHDPSPLVPRAFAESVAYQKSDAAVQKTLARTQAEVSNLPNRLVANLSVATPQVATWNKAPLISLPPVGASSGLGLTAPYSPEKPAAPTVTSANASENGKAERGVAALCKDAQQYANLARYDEAIRLCREAISLDPTCDEAYFIWAQVEGEQGRSDEAKNLFKKVIYLAPNRYDVHLEIAALYQAEKDFSRARRERQAALELLRELPADQMLSSHPGVKVAELRGHLEEELQAIPGAQR